jgi:hypothetical protein
MIKKMILSQAKKILVEEARKMIRLNLAEKKDRETYLNFLNSGIFVDLERLKSAMFKQFERVISEIDKK